MIALEKFGVHATDLLKGSVANMLCQRVITRGTVGLNVGGYALRKEVGGEFLDVRLLMEEEMILGLFELDSQEIVAITLVFHLPSFLQLGGEVTIEGMVVDGGVENAQVIDVDTEM